MKSASHAKIRFRLFYKNEKNLISGISIMISLKKTEIQPQIATISLLEALIEAQYCARLCCNIAPF